MGSVDSFERVFWCKDAPPAPSFPALTGELKCDVVIIGAGIMGLSCALALREHGVDVVVLEANEPGVGASGRNGGLVVPSMPRLGPSDALRLLGPDYGARLLAMVADSAQHVFELISRYGLRCDAVQRGWLNPAHAAEMVPALQLRAHDWARAGSRAVWVPRDEAVCRIGSSQFHGALFDPSGGHLNPLAYTRELARVAASLGARIYGNSPVSAVTGAAGQWRVASAQGTISARVLLQCTNAMRLPGAAPLAPRVDRSFVPLGVYELATAPLQDAVKKTLLPGDEALSDSRNNLFACCRTVDHRLVTGGMAPVTHLGAEGRLRRALGRRLQRIFPQLGPVSFDYVWRGTAALTPDFLPRLLTVAEGWYAPLGCNGRGIAMSTSLGRRLADYLATSDATDLPIPTGQPLPIALHSVARYVPQMLLPLGILQDRLRK
ncbi:Gamma-glutamylputrescine oxidoreductase (plasmid) [Caballeronia sp. SBC1]|uniref:NAD(P)/FAD-dependent oxidoreductase n=1 Tax=Caballeronia sp. SBC1 TaxID=2705548 RepID=UPI00140A20C6|nr:FAD-binding oxidoreductase [Caballeronia sp. SBC1]QIN67933.1 Gamma-glutamylputrescine oxidoreductase [Caballeronia sp. SBC1]